MMDDDEDMFAEFERTMLESMHLSDSPEIDTTFNDKSKKEPEIDTDCLEITKNLNLIHGPAVRGYNLFKSTLKYKEKEILESVYCETMALSLWMRIKFHANKIMEPNDHIPTDDNLEELLEAKEEQPEFIDYLDRFLKNLTDEQPKKIPKSIEFENGTELMNLCYKLPKEWTVIQLCKQVNTEQHLQTRAETLRHPCLIFITFFCYPMSERFDNKPIKIALNQENLKELYESCCNFSQRMNDTTKGPVRMTASEFQKEYVDKLKKLLGPWIVLFSGKSKYLSSQEKEKIKQVDAFLSSSKNKYSGRQNVLLCLIARRLYMLTDKDIRDAALFISSTKEEWFELMDFLYDLKQDHYDEITDCYPVILVVDEHIDFFYWEMCNPKQEFTRVESMVTLFQLYFDHKDNISDGYFNIKHRRGSAVLNPDLTLPSFETHQLPLIEKFGDPKWTVLVEQTPQFNELRTMLADSGIYVAVVYLAGCSSVAFSALTGYSLGSGAHQYYHVAKCPAVIGHLNLTYTNYASVCLNFTLCQWFFKQGKIPSDLYGSSKKEVDLAEHLQKCVVTAVESPYLTKVIADCRTTEPIDIAYRAILCYRGLPVCLNIK